MSRIIFTFLCLLVCLPAAHAASWKDIAPGSTVADAEAVFGTPRETRGERLIYPAKEEWKEVVAESAKGKIKSFTVHFREPKPGAEIFVSAEQFEVLRAGADLARRKIRVLGVPSKGWLIESDDSGKVVSLSVEKSWKPKGGLQSWAEAHQKAWKK